MFKLIHNLWGYCHDNLTAFQQYRPNVAESQLSICHPHTDLCCMPYSTGVSSTMLFIFVLLHWSFPVLVAYIASLIHGHKECHYKANSNQD